jgi:hypothetical protein
VFVYADQRGRTGPQAGSAATPLCWHQVQVRSLLTLQVRPLPVDDRSECWSASRKISCAQGPCQLQCRFQLLITYVAVIWVSIAYLYSLRVLNCMGHFCEHRPRTRLCDFDFDCCGIAMHISVTDLICCCDLGFNCVHSVRNAECFPFMKFLCLTVLSGWIQVLLLIVLWEYFVIIGESCHPDDISVSVLYGVLIQLSATDVYCCGSCSNSSVLSLNR